MFWMVVVQRYNSEIMKKLQVETDNKTNNNKTMVITAAQNCGKNMGDDLSGLIDIASPRVLPQSVA